MKHINLYVEGAGNGGTQPVEVQESSSSTFLVLHSPGFVEGIAEGDLIRVTNEELGYFEVLERGGNISIKWGVPSSDLGSQLPVADKLLSSIGAELDGALSNAAVWTVSAAVGFSAIEKQMEKIVALIPESRWWYGNVYNDDGEPLNWW